MCRRERPGPETLNVAGAPGRNSSPPWPHPRSERRGATARPRGAGAAARRADEGGAERTSFSDPAWIYRAQARRHPLCRDPRRRRDRACCRATTSISAAATPRSVRRSPPRPDTGGSRSTARSSPSTARRRASRRLAQRGHHPVPVFYYVFDLLWLDGADVRALPLRTRKRLLHDAISFDDPLRWTPHRNRDGEAMFEEACRKGWEGVIAKRADSPYSSTRSQDWLKFKCEAGQELVIGGFTAPRGSRTEFGALLLGYYDGDSCATRARSAPASTPRRCRRSAPAARAAPSRHPRSPTPASIRERGRHLGQARARRPGRRSPSGPAPAGCATRGSSACATTSRPSKVVREA